MRITKYKVMINSENLHYLEKECACNYKIDGSINTPQKVCELVNRLYKLNQLAEEHLYMLAFNKRLHIIGVFEVSHGSIDESVCSPRDIYKRALLCGATSIILIHNHPSGNTEVSRCDRETCSKIVNAGDIIGVPLYDFIVVGGDNYYSMQERGEL